MNRFVLASLLVASAAWAARPHGARSELMPAPTEPAEDRPLNRVFSADLGVGAWSSSLVVAGSIELGLGLGRRVSRHVLISGQLDLAASMVPNLSAYRIALGAAVAWDVLELVRSHGGTVPVELGPEVGVGVALMNFQALALPELQAGLFGRIVLSPGVSLGVRLRTHLPFWTNAPTSFTAGRTIVPAPLEPAGFTGTLSFVHTY